MPRKKMMPAKAAKRSVAASQLSEKFESQKHRERMEALERIATAIDKLAEAIREGNRLRGRPAPGLD
jgi:hypothetical protein